MEMHVDDQDGLTVVRVDDTRIDASVAIQFKDTFRGLVSGRQGTVLLDLSMVEFLDSSGLGAVVAARKLLGPNRPLDLCGLQPAVDKVMALTRMNTVFKIYKDRAQAIAQTAPAPGTI